MRLLLGRTRDVTRPSASRPIEPCARLDVIRERPRIVEVRRVLKSGDDRVPPGFQRRLATTPTFAGAARRGCVLVPFDAGYVQRLFNGSTGRKDLRTFGAEQHASTRLLDHDLGLMRSDHCKGYRPVD